MRKLALLFTLLSIVFFSCEKRKIKRAHDKMMGKWLEVSPCNGCDTIIIDYETIHFKQRNQTDVYELISETKFKTIGGLLLTHSFEFKDNGNTLFIEKIILSINGTEREDIEMNKL